MTFKDLINYYGSVEKASNAIGYSRMSLYNWRDNGIPERTQRLLEAVTNGKLLAKAKK
jgi:DNA-binding transcriptional regulator Cro